MSGAGNEIRTRDLNLGKIGFYYDLPSPINGSNLLIGNAFSPIVVYKIEYVKLEWHRECHQFNCQLPPHLLTYSLKYSMLDGCIG